MNKVLKAVAAVLVVVVLGVLGTVLFVTSKYPDVPLVEGFAIETSPAIVARGTYLVNHVSLCFDCHTPRDMSLQTGPIEQHLLGQGGDGFLKEQGFPGDFYPANITPAGIGDYTDAELYRAITSGVGRDGHAMFPLMPYLAFGRADLSDINAVMAYIRTLPPGGSPAPRSHPAFPVNIFFRFAPKPADHQQRPDTSDTIAYGAYMANLAACVECHTPMDDRGQPIAGMEFAGGAEFELPSGTVRSANITPDRATGIGSWSADAFVGRFRQFADSSFVPPPVGPRDFNTVMPWTGYAGMTELDLRAIYHYLMSLPPVSHSVEHFTAAE